MMNWNLASFFLAHVWLVLTSTRAIITQLCNKVSLVSENKFMFKFYGHVESPHFKLAYFESPHFKLNVNVMQGYLYRAFLLNWACKALLLCSVLNGPTQFCLPPTHFIPATHTFYTRKGRERLRTFIHPQRMTKRCCSFYGPRKGGSLSQAICPVVELNF